MAGAVAPAVVLPPPAPWTLVAHEWLFRHRCAVLPTMGTLPEPLQDWAPLDAARFWAHGQIAPGGPGRVAG